MRGKWYNVSAVALILLCVSSQSVSASGLSSAKQLSAFKKLDGVYSDADNKWTNALSSLTASSTVAQVSKPSLAFVPAIKAFDAGLKKVAFTGKVATEIAAVIKTNEQLQSDLSSIKSVKGLQVELRALLPKDEPLQQALAKDFGVPAGDIVV
jgi:hypothetical protein